jgi:hypothetical protein
MPLSLACCFVLLELGKSTPLSNQTPGTLMAYFQWHEPTERLGMSNETWRVRRAADTTSVFRQASDFKWTEQEKQKKRGPDCDLAWRYVTGVSKNVGTWKRLLLLKQRAKSMSRLRSG